MQIETFILENPWILLLILAWTLPWKGYALWRSAKNSDNKWFLVLFLVNTLAILEIFYIFVIDKNNKKIKSILNYFKN
ncbi:hypothetical protein KKG48_00275 [Patescibacteria group bacterium]|nr:hypothetical protein [Patescibacteria group bacterium]MCG2694932.1 DUF5652 family protein [Candidatus Parcubacteria bacterium]